MTRPEIEAERMRRGAVHWDPAAPLGLVFIREPGQAAGFGSYMVFRKLEQNVRHFRSARAALAQAMGCSDEEASGLIVGRRSDGTPLIPTQTPDATADPNDFDYGSDSPSAPGPAGVCPFHAHIRRSNPRGDTVRYLGAPSTDFERGMRIVRRGVTYGLRPDLDGDGEPPERDVGLLFMSFQADLRQFAIQQSGADSADFPFGGAGLEGLNGRTAGGGDPLPQSWPAASGQVLFSLGGFVTLKGGEYLFAPSLPFLKSLAPPG
jgi:deferrochelatase/peroxidase EfeB